MLLVLLILMALFVFGYVFMLQPQFGKAPSGARLERLQQSPHYRDGQFHNESVTPSFTDGATFFSVMQEFLFSRNKNGKPTGTIPSKKINLHGLPAHENVLVWFGHSSYFLQLDGKKILVDPVLNGSASPVSFTTRSFEGSDAYTPDDIPAIDLLLITHDHWDHMDYTTLQNLKGRIKTVVTGLGVGAHLEHWGFDTSKIIEADWYQSVPLPDGITLHLAPARHFSGRGFKRNGTLWSSFVLATPQFKIYIGGDSGFDQHFKKVGTQHGPFDLAILENGQYDKSWKYIHMMPEEVVQAAQELNAKQLLAVHWGKFALANHAWNEPITRVSKEAKRLGVPLLTPMIGEAVYLQDSTKIYSPWWERVQ